MSMNVIELTEAPEVEEVPEGATCFCLNPDGSVNRFKLDGLSRAEVIFRVYFPSTVSESASDGESIDPTVTCDKTASEIKALIESGKKVDYRCFLWSDDDDGFSERLSSVGVILHSFEDDSKGKVASIPFLAAGFMSYYRACSFTLSVFQDNTIDYSVIGGMG